MNRINMSGIILSWMVKLAFMLNLSEDLYMKRTFITNFKLFVVIIALYSHNMTYIVSPGIIDIKMKKKKSSDKKSQTKFWNKYVSEKHGNILYPPSAHWCSIKNAMVMRMDHFCPWTNNTIGLFNFKPFFLFCVYTFLTCSFTLINSFYREHLCLQYHEYCIFEKYVFYLCVFNLITGTFGFIFTFVMIIECLKSIYYNAAYIDRLKKIRSSGNFNDTFRLLLGKWFFIPSVRHEEIKMFYEREIENTLTILKKHDIYKDE